MPRFFSEQPTEQKYKLAEQELRERLGPLEPALSHFTGENPAVVLSIGSGDTPFEIPVLSGFCPIRYLGVELDQDAVKACKYKYSGKDNVDFVAADGKDKTTIRQSLLRQCQAEQADILIMRHPVLHSSNSVRNHFIKIWLDVVPKFLKPGGTLIVTFYHPEEFDAGIRLTQSIVQDPGTVTQHIEQSGGICLRSETQRTALSDIDHELRENRFMLSVTNFQPKPFLLCSGDDKKIDAYLRELDLSKGVEGLLAGLVGAIKFSPSFEALLVQALSGKESLPAFLEKYRFAFTKYSANPALLKERLQHLLCAIRSMYEAGTTRDQDIEDAFAVAVQLPLRKDLGEDSSATAEPVVSPVSWASFGLGR